MHHDFVLLEIETRTTPDPNDGPEVLEWAKELLFALRDDDPNEIPFGVHVKWERDTGDLCPIDLIRERKKLACDRSMRYLTGGKR
jgi:hypothetical protein